MPRWPLALPALLASAPAWASWPEDIDLYSMTDQGGVAQVDPKVLGESYRQLVMELGTLVANKPVTPADTLGMDGFDVDLSNQFVLTEARDRLGEPSPWSRAHRDETPAPYRMVPTLGFRKGLPLSTEIGGSMGWVGGTSTGVVGGFARVAVLEGAQPLPDISLKIGYSGYVGSDQLDCGALDLSATIGTTRPLGRLPGVNVAQLSPWFTFTTLRVSANATIDEEVEDQIGAIRYARETDDEPDAAAAIPLPMFGGGVQVVSGGAHLRVAVSWAPATIPAVVSGFGFTF